MTDVVIVGGGFAGLYTGFWLAKKGFDVVIFEEHKEIGIPHHCAGLISISGLDRIGLLKDVINKRIFFTKIRRAKLFFHNCIRKLDAHEYISLEVDREKLDKLLAEKAINNGAEIILGERIKRITRDGRVKASNREINAKVVVNAEGAAGYLLKLLTGRKYTSPILAFQFDAKIRKEIPTDCVEVYFNTPDFFSWIIPLSEKEVRVGVVSNYIRPLSEFAHKFARKRFGEIKVLRKYGGLVITDGPIPRFVYGKIVCIGDTAGQTKPTTGGGVVFSGISGMILVKVIEKHLELGISLLWYEKIWKRILGKHRSFMRKFRSLFYFTDARATTSIAKFIPQFIFDRIKGDFDFQIDAFLKLIPLIRGKTRGKQLGTTSHHVLE